MSRDARLFLEDIVNRVERVQALVSDRDFGEFTADDGFHEAVLRHLTIIGEAAKQVPPDMRALEPNIPWRKIAKLRDLLFTFTSRSTTD